MASDDEWDLGALEEMDRLVEAAYSKARAPSSTPPPKCTHHPCHLLLHARALPLHTPPPPPPSPPELPRVRRGDG